MEETDNEFATKEQSTIDLYERIYARIQTMTKQDLREAGAGDENVDSPPYLAIVQTFFERESTWSKSTAKLYRIALSYCLTQEGTMDAYDAKRVLKRENFDDIYDEEMKQQAIHEADAHAEKVNAKRIERLAAIAAGAEKPRTSGQKAKKLKKDEFQLILKVLNESKSQWKDETVMWMLSGYYTGLRPGEWAEAILGRDSKGRLTLVAKNAKATNNRSFSDRRKILLTKLTIDEIQILKRHVDTANFHHRNGTYKKFYDSCRLLLLATNQRIWPKRKSHPTLYTVRHMFASDAKSVMGKTEVAALMGHGSEKTAGLHYGKRRYGKGSLGVEPSEADVIKVANLNPIDSHGGWDPSKRGIVSGDNSNKTYK